MIKGAKAFLSRLCGGEFAPAAVCASAIGILWAAGAGLPALVDSKSKGKKNPFTVEGVF